MKDNPKFHKKELKTRIKRINSEKPEVQQGACTQLISKT